jgi:hypothetical protein
VAALALAVLGLAGCGDDGGDRPSALGATTTTSAGAPAGGAGCDVDGAVAGGTEPGAAVELALSEFAFGLSQASAPAGPVELVARNDGRIAHEVVVVRFDGDPGAIARNPVGGADTSTLGAGAEVGKIWSFEPGATCRATFDLAPGRYALICNVVDDGTNPHYSQGMHAGFVAE